ncbi:MAG TPA: DoxX family protein [Candidatus Baltobacteraceae bacterium]|nr:DoxX family protein [Candidatus Baltobacteraceae bacterium]
MLLHKLMHNPVTAYLRKPANADCAKLVIRFAVGAVFIYHGKMKLFGGLAMTTGFFDKIGIPFPGLMAPFIGSLEFFGGILLILGLATRLLGFMFVCDMAVAILVAKGLVWGKNELEIMLLLSSLSLLLSGAGAYSLDAMLMKRSLREHEFALPMAKA